MALGLHDGARPSKRLGRKSCQGGVDRYYLPEDLVCRQTSFDVTKLRYRLLDMVVDCFEINGKTLWKLTRSRGGRKYQGTVLEDRFVQLRGERPAGKILNSMGKTLPDPTARP